MIQLGKEFYGDKILYDISFVTSYVHILKDGLHGYAKGSVEQPDIMDEHLETMVRGIRLQGAFYIRNYKVPDDQPRFGEPGKRSGNSLESLLIRYYRRKFEFVHFVIERFGQLGRNRFVYLKYVVGIHRSRMLGKIRRVALK